MVVCLLLHLQCGRTPPRPRPDCSPEPRLTERCVDRCVPTTLVVQATKLFRRAASRRDRSAHIFAEAVTVSLWHVLPPEMKPCDGLGKH